MKPADFAVCKSARPKKWAERGARHRRATGHNLVEVEDFLKPDRLLQTTEARREEEATEKN